VVLRQQSFLLVLLREAQEDERHDAMQAAAGRIAAPVSKVE
jgi:hypothetical protein